jgi:hypothetical protein
MLKILARNAVLNTSTRAARGVKLLDVVSLEQLPLDESENEFHVRS